MAMRGLDRFKTWRVMGCMALFNLLTVALIGAYFWEQRSNRIEAQAAVTEWMAKPLYAPTELTVMVGPTMQSTRIVERPLFDGPRVLADFSGSWVTQLRHVDTDSLLCTMPQTGPRWHPYVTSAPHTNDRTWASYTGDQGECFERMAPCQKYDLTVVREAFIDIDGDRYHRFLPAVRSEPFTIPGECE